MAKKTNFEINGNKYYRVKRIISHKNDGTPISKQFYGKSKSEAEEKANEYINKIKSGLILDFDSITIDTLLYKWLFEIKINEIKPSSFQSYEGTYRNYIKNSDISRFKNIFHKIYSDSRIL